VVHWVCMDEDTVVEKQERPADLKSKRVKEEIGSSSDATFWQEVFKPKSDRTLVNRTPEIRVDETSAPAVLEKVYPKPAKEDNHRQSFAFQNPDNIHQSFSKQLIQGSKPPLIPKLEPLAKKQQSTFLDEPPGIPLSKAKGIIAPVVIQTDDSSSIISSVEGNDTPLSQNGTPNLTTLAQADKMKDYSTVSVAVVVSKVHMPYLRPTAKGERMFQSIELEDQSGKMPIIVWGDQAKAIQWEQGKPYLLFNTKTQVYNNRKNLFYQEGCPVEAKEIRPTDPYFVALKPVIQRLTSQVCQGTWSNGDHSLYDSRKVARLGHVKENSGTIFGAATTEACRLVYKSVVQMINNRTELMPEKCPACVDRMLDYLPKTETFNCFGCVSSYREIKCRKVFWVTWKDDSGELECKTDSQKEFDDLIKHITDFGTQTKIRIEITAQKTANGKEIEHLFRLTE